MATSRIAFILALAGALWQRPAVAQAQAAPAQPTSGQPAADATGKQRNFKDRAEYDLYEAVRTATDGNVALQKLNEWKEKYKDTEYEKERRTFYLNTYVKLGQMQNAINAAKDLLALDPTEFAGVYYITLLTPQLGASGATLTPDQLDQADKAANSILGGGLDKQFSSDKKPATTSDADWKTARTGIEAVAHTTLGYDAMQGKKNDEAETQFKQSLAINPNDGNVAYWLGTVILLEKKQEKQSEGLYYLARAAAYDGPGALNPAGRKTVEDYVSKAYKGYHGSNDGFDQLMQQAKASATPPPDFKIVSANEIAAGAAKKQQEEDAKNPSLTIWKGIKAALGAADGATYFSSSMKDALLPTFTGKVVKLEPETRPKSVFLAIEDGTTVDAVLKFEPALGGKVEPGTVLSFEGVPESYTSNPVIVTFKVDKDKLHGWTGKAEPAARKPVTHRAPPRKK